MWFSREMATAFQLCRTIRKFFLNVRKPSTLFHRTKCSASWHDLNWTSTQTIEWNWWEKRNCFASRCEIETVFRSQSPSTKVKMSLNSMRAAWLVTWLPNYKALTLYTIEHTQKTDRYTFKMYNNADEKYGVCNSADEWWQIYRVAWALRISFLLSFICRNDNYLRSGRFIRMRFAFCEFAHNLATSHCHCDRFFFHIRLVPQLFDASYIHFDLEFAGTVYSCFFYSWMSNAFHGKSFFTNES